MRVYYFGCWNGPGHFLHSVSGRQPGDARHLEYFGAHVHIDGTLAPRSHMRTGALRWTGMQETSDGRQRLQYDSIEYDQGLYLTHHLDTGFAIAQWWDRCQGDQRGACNSSILAEGRHSGPELIALLNDNFPHVVTNLTARNVKLVEVIPTPELLRGH